MAGEVRIIAGRWRRRRLRVVDAPDVRPTPDRVRETVFNWLSSSLHGATCLDLFAGSGALGFEAVSRGAARAVLLDRDRAVLARLEQECERLDAGDAIRVLEADALAWLDRPACARFDVVFVDPPRRLEVHREAMSLLAAHGWLAPDARVYLETGRHPAMPTLDPGWTVLRSGRAGDVRYHFASHDPSGC